MSKPTNIEFQILNLFQFFSFIWSKITNLVPCFVTIILGHLFLVVTFAVALSLVLSLVLNSFSVLEINLACIGALRVETGGKPVALWTWLVFINKMKNNKTDRTQRHLWPLFSRNLLHFEMKIVQLVTWELQFWSFSECKISPLLNRTLFFFVEVITRTLTHFKMVMGNRRSFYAFV